MEGLYDTVESTLVWGAVILTLAVIIYLAFLQYLKMKRRRAYHRHRARRALAQPNGFAGERRHSHRQPS